MTDKKKWNEPALTDLDIDDTENAPGGQEDDGVFNPGEMTGFSA